MHHLYKFITILTLLFISLTTHAGGGITHMLIAEQSIKHVSDMHLRNLLLDNLDAYLVGANYPDSGFVAGTHYGEDSHWDPFIFTFADYIKQTYSQPEFENPRLVAFLFGCATHSVSDIIIHWTFYPKSAAEDFHGNWNLAHQHGDFDLDLVINVDKDRWFAHPQTWWVPVQELTEVYRRMGKSEYTSKEIILGNSIYSLAGIGERAIALPAYPFLKLKMPWTTKHYEDAKEGGLLVDEVAVAKYMDQLWLRLHNKPYHLLHLTAFKKPPHHDVSNPAIRFAEDALQNGTASMPAATKPDGSVEINAPVIVNAEQYNRLLSQLEKRVE